MQGSLSGRGETVRLLAGQPWETHVMSDLDVLTKGMRDFTAARQWGRFHDPKSLALALVGEVGELAELLQWLPADEASDLVRHDPLHTRLGEEMSDVLLYLVRLADVAGIDLAQAAHAKLEAADRRFAPAEYLDRAPAKD